MLPHTRTRAHTQFGLASARTHAEGQGGNIALFRMSRRFRWRFFSFFCVHATCKYLQVEKIIRSRIYEAIFWKESCFALTAEGPFPPPSPPSSSFTSNLAIAGSAFPPTSATDAVLLSAVRLDRHQPGDRALACDRACACRPCRPSVCSPARVCAPRVALRVHAAPLTVPHGINPYIVPHPSAAIYPPTPPVPRISLHPRTALYFTTTLERLPYHPPYHPPYPLHVPFADVVEVGADLTFVGGVATGYIKPSPFLCTATSTLILDHFLRESQLFYTRAPCNVLYEVRVLIAPGIGC